MFAYCENNAINKSDDEGKDAWWIQSPNSVPLILGNAGHTSLLLQEKSGYWWYFYWGDRSVQLLFIETSSLGKLQLGLDIHQKNIKVKTDHILIY